MREHLDARRADDAARNRRIETVSAVLAGPIPVPGGGDLRPGAPEWGQAVDDHYAGLADTLETMDPDTRARFEDDYARATGVLPGPVLKQVRGGLLSDDPAAQAFAATRIDRLNDADPDVIDIIPEDERRRARDIAGFVDLGLPPPRAVELVEEKLADGGNGEDRQPPGEPPKAPEPDQPPPDDAKPGGGDPGEPPKKPSDPEGPPKKPEPGDPGEPPRKPGDPEAPPKKPDDPEAPPKKPGTDDPNKPNPCQPIKDVLAKVNRQILEIRQEITGKEGEIAWLKGKIARLKESKDKDTPIDEDLLKRIETPTHPLAKLLRLILPRLVVREIDKSFDPILRIREKRLLISGFEEEIAKLKLEVEDLRHKEENKLKNEDFWRKQLVECEAENR